MKNTHEEGDRHPMHMQLMVLALLENQEKISATVDITDAFLLNMFSVPDSQAKHCCGKVITSEREICLD